MSGAIGWLFARGRAGPAEAARPPARYTNSAMDAGLNGCK